MNKMMSTNNVLLKTENGKTHFAVVKMAKAKSELKKKFNFFFFNIYQNILVFIFKQIRIQDNISSQKSNILNSTKHTFCVYKLRAQSFFNIHQLKDIYQHFLTRAKAHLKIN